MTDKQGLTLVELIVSISLIGIIFSVMSPIIYTAVESFRSINTHKIYNQDARATILLFQTLLENTEHIYTTESDEFKFMSDGIDFDFTLALSSGGDSYELFLAKDTGSDYLLLDNIAKLTGPIRPGLEFSYFNQNHESVSITTNVRSVEIDLVMQGDENQYIFFTALNVNADEIDLN
ncbi:type II secretion system protein [bacterium]|jgi:prepilin-type N-terminal cleavage/methylation domain-containing protein|nr:type II secretion system protein [bacterium]